MSNVAWRYGRRRALPTAVAGTLICGYLVLRASSLLGSIVWGLALLANVILGWRCWVNPMPSGYAERVERSKASEQAFGRKLWHKFAIGFLAIVGIYCVVYWTVAAVT